MATNFMGGVPNSPVNAMGDPRGAIGPSQTGGMGSVVPPMGVGVNPLHLQILHSLLGGQSQGWNPLGGFPPAQGGAMQPPPMGWQPNGPQMGGQPPMGGAMQQQPDLRQILMQHILGGGQQPHQILWQHLLGRLMGQR